MGPITQHRSKPKNLFLRIACVSLLVVIPFLFVHFRQSRPSAGRADSVVRVERKNLTETLRLNGTTQASRSFIVLAPRLEGAQVGSMVITKLAPSGMHVKKDDLLSSSIPRRKRKTISTRKAPTTTW